MSEHLEPISKKTLEPLSPELNQNSHVHFADDGVIAAAIYEVIDDDKEEHHAVWHPFQDVANTARREFVEAVLKRIRRLQGPGFNLGVKLENVCDRHKRLYLPLPSVVTCADCEKEARERI